MPVKVFFLRWVASVVFFCLHFHFVHYIACWRSDEWLLDKTGLLFLSCSSQGVTGKCRWMNSCEYADTDGFSSPSPGSFSGFLFIQIREYVKKKKNINMPICLASGAKYNNPDCKIKRDDNAGFKLPRCSNCFATKCRSKKCSARCVGV